MKQIAIFLKFISTLSNIIKCVSMNKNQKKVTYPYFFTNREQNVNIHKFPYNKTHIRSLANN